VRDAATPEARSFARRAMDLLTAVLLPWLLSRALVDAAALLVAQAQNRPSGFASLSAWDGGWYLAIARRGYAAVQSGPQTAYPFFPLFPLLLATGGALGLPLNAVGVVVDHLAMLLGMLGLFVLVERRFSRAAAFAACWTLALWPGSAPFSLVYPEALLLASSAWTFVALDDDRPLVAGLLGAVAALVRPNGLLVSAAAALGARSPRAALLVLAPPIVAIAGWMAVLWAWTGDPLIFGRAKLGWHEATFWGLVSGAEPVPKIDLAFGLLAALALLAGWRRLPLSWRGFAVAWLGLPLATGVLGLPRYAASCFPVFGAAGILLARAPRAVRALWLTGSAVALFVLALRITSGRMTP
jgi:mannosyltransferase PIG-V